MTLPTPPAPGGSDDIAAAVICLLLFVFALVMDRAKAEHDEIIGRHEREDREAFNQTIGERPRPRLLTEADIVDRARKKGR